MHSHFVYTVHTFTQYMTWTATQYSMSCYLSISVMLICISELKLFSSTLNCCMLFFQSHTSDMRTCVRLLNTAKVSWVRLYQNIIYIPALPFSVEFCSDNSSDHISLPLYVFCHKMRKAPKEHRSEYGLWAIAKTIRTNEPIGNTHARNHTSTHNTIAKIMFLYVVTATYICVGL